MRDFALFVMKSRLHAGLSALALGILALVLQFQLYAPMPGLLAGVLCAGVICLSVFRQGAVEGLLVLTWGGLPALLWGLIHQNPAVFLEVILAYLLACLVAITGEWWKALAGALVLAFLAVQVSYQISPELYIEMATQTLDMLGEMSPQLQLDQFRTLMPPVILGSVGVFMIVGATLGMGTGQWLSNLVSEDFLRTRHFASLRLPLGFSLLCLLLIVAGGRLGPPGITLSVLAFAPLLIAGLGLVHGLAALTSSPLLVSLSVYLLLLMLPPLLLLLALTAVADSFLNFRGRVAVKKQPPPQSK
jgi:hypothetical protein